MMIIVNMKIMLIGLLIEVNYQKKMPIVIVIRDCIMYFPFLGEPVERDNTDLGNGQMDENDQRDDQSDTTELDLLAESESDSDDNQSNQDPTSVQSRSEQTGATLGSDTGKKLRFVAIMSALF